MAGCRGRPEAARADDHRRGEEERPADDPDDPVIGRPVLAGPAHEPADQRRLFDRVEVPAVGIRRAGRGEPAPPPEERRDDDRRHDQRR